MKARTIWRRYRSTAAWAMVVSAGLGAVCGLAVYLGGNADYRVQSGWGGFSYWVALGAVFGLVTGIAASVGAAVALVWRGRDLTRSRWSRISIGVAGASIGALVLWGIVGVIIAATGGLGGLAVAVCLGVIAAAVTAVSARVMLARVERR